MRKISFLWWLVLLCLTSSIVHAQQDTTTFEGKSKYIFEHIDKSQITSGLLGEHGAELLPFANYNGTLLADSNYVGLQEWRQLYGGLYSAQINANANLPLLDNINSTIMNYIGLDKPITFAVMHYNYQTLRTDAVSANLFTVSNDQLFDVPGRSQSPYVNQQLFAVAPIRQVAVVGDNPIIFRPELFFSNTGKTIAEIAVAVGTNESYATVPFNTPYNLSFMAEGFTDVNIRITYTDASINYAHSKLLVYPAPASANNSSTGGGNQTLDFSPHRTITNMVLTADKSYQGQLASGDIAIQLSVNNNTGQIRKPLIVVEGFDMNNSYNFDDFIGSISLDGNTRNPVQSITLNQSLDDTNSYDIIFLNFANATDYIQRNAFLLEKVIQEVNNRKTTYNGTRQENVVIGLSMGGLVARYALRDMEVNNQAHETRLMITHDTPHHGANIPVGIQAAVQHLSGFKIIDGFLTWKDLFPDLVQALNAFNSPAAKQMIIQRYNLGLTYNLIPDNSAYNSFYSELNNMGWPLSCKNLTLSNGSVNGTQVFPAGSRIFELIGSKSLSYFSQLGISALMSIGAPLAPIAVSGGNVNPASLLIQFPLSVISTKTSLNVDFRINSIPQNGTAELYRGDIYIKRKLLWLINSTSYFIKTRINSISGMLPLDNAPGGVYDINEFGFNPSAISLLGFTSTVLQPRFCFVPTVSSLAIQNPWQNLNTNISQQVNCLNPASVKSYLAPLENQLHISYTQPSANWLLQWQNASFDCTKQCLGSVGNLAISGASQLPNTATYTIPNLPAGATVTWTSSHPNIASVSTNGNTATLTKVYYGPIKLRAIVTLACNNYVIPDKSIDVGIPDMVNVNIIPTPAQMGMYKQLSSGEIYYNLYADQLPNYTYKWEFAPSGGSAPLYIGNSTLSSAWIEGYSEGSIYTGTLTLSDGFSSKLVWRQIFKVIPGNSSFNMFPNPTSNSLTVTQNTLQQKASQQNRVEKSSLSVTVVKPYQIKLFDKNARMLKEATSNGEDVNINTSNLPNGTYFLHILQGKEVVKKQVVVQH